MAITDTIQEYLSDFFSYLTAEWYNSFVILVLLFGVYLFLADIPVSIRVRQVRENLVIGLTMVSGAIGVIVSNSVLLGFLIALLIIILYQLYLYKGAPVWRDFLIISTVSYLLLLSGQILTVIYDNDRWFGIAYTSLPFVFLFLSFLFFGRRFIVVSRFISPQILYLSIFIIAYLGIYFLDLQNYDYLSSINVSFIPESVQNRVLFLSFGTYEAIGLSILGLYFVSGILLKYLLGIKKVEDQHILDLVEEVRLKLGIKQKIKVGWVKAPILNAFAFGPFFDKRIAFISKDTDEFTDDDIRGIAAHELAHTAKNHVFILLLLSWFELGLKKAVGLPATTIDFAFESDTGISFLTYIFYNYILAIGLFVVVRMMEGQADGITKRVGYGDELAASLFRLESFYQGIAGDFGLSVNLLTDKEYSPAEQLKYSGDAASRLLKTLYAPGTLWALSNIIMSHPRTTFRIAAMVDDEISQFTSAFLPYFLVIPFLRGKYRKKLMKSFEKYQRLLDDTFIATFGNEGIVEYTKNTNTQYLSNELYKNQLILAQHVYTQELVIGISAGTKASDSISSPLDIHLLDATVWKPGKENELAVFFERDGENVRLISNQEYLSQNAEKLVPLNGSSISILSPGNYHIQNNGDYDIPFGILVRQGRVKYYMQDGMSTGMVTKEHILAYWEREVISTISIGNGQIAEGEKDQGQLDTIKMQNVSQLAGLHAKHYTLSDVPVIEQNGFDVSKKDIKIKKLPGYPLQYFLDLIPEQLPVQVKGQPYIDRITNISLSTHFGSAEITVDREGETFTLKGSKMLFELPPIGFSLKHNEETNLALLNWMLGKRLQLITLQNIEIPIVGILEEIKEETIIFNPGSDEREEIKIKEIEYVALMEPLVQISPQNEIGTLDRIIIWYQNRSGTQYIRPRKA